MEIIGGSASGSIFGKFEADETNQGIHRQRFGRPRTTASFTCRERIMESYSGTREKYVKLLNHEHGISKPSLRGYK